MPYINNPKWASELERIIRATVYVLILWGSIASVVTPSPALFAQFSHSIIVLAAVTIGIAAIPALYGVLRRLYRYEWVSVWVIAGGIGCYATAAWARTISTPSSTLASCNLTIAFAFFTLRAINLTVYAQRARAERRLISR